MDPSTGDRFTDSAMRRGSHALTGIHFYPDDPPADPPADPPVAPPTDPPADPPKSFTEDDVNRIVKERLARAKTAPPADYDELKTKAAEFDKLKESQKSELEKERDRATAAETRAQQVEADAKELRLRSAILAEAAKPDRKVVDTGDVIALLDRSTLTLDDDGNPTNIAEAMDSLLKAKPHLVAGNGGARGNADLGARGGGKALTRDDLQTMSSAEIVKAQNDGLLDHLLGAKT